MLLLVGSLARYFVVDGAALLLTAFYVEWVRLYPVGISWAHQANFPKMAMMTGLYSATLMAGGAIGAQITPLVEEMTGHWQSALAWLAFPALLALLAIWANVHTERAQKQSRSQC